MIDIQINDINNSFKGYILFTPTVDDPGGKIEKVNNIYLINTNGKLIHKWSVLGSIQLAKLKSKGNLLYSTRDRSFRKRAGIREIDPFGNVIWYFNCWADHDFYLFPNGNILIHYIEDKIVPLIGVGKIRCPRIVELTPKGEIIWEWKSEQHLHELSSLIGIKFPLNKIGQKLFDWAHNNTCQIIGENKIGLQDYRFKPGNIIFSYCNLN
ncbi:MAG: aryl-sulfate sulfotransferase, partial [Promethearchaeota archaeon]